MDARELVAPFERLIEAVASPANVRAVEAGGPVSAIWSEIEQSGFLDALVPERVGGAGLTMADICPLVHVLGAFAVPLPVAETMVSRALLADAGITCPTGPIAFASGIAGQSVIVPHGLVAEHILWDDGATLTLADVAGCGPQPTGVHHSQSAFLQRPTGQEFARPESGLRLIGAALRSAEIAGAVNHVLAMTVDYANQRIQFGKPIGKQQVLQQNMAVMAEHAVAARIASELAFDGDLPLRKQAVAAAKIIAGEAASFVSATAHAVFGAIGISEEFDLQLFTRRLHDMRFAHGGESYWANHLGAAHLASAADSISFVRSNLFEGSELPA